MYEDPTEYDENILEAFRENPEFKKLLNNLG
jgi:hypothetical protein